MIVPSDIRGPLTFWKHHANHYPKLAKTSRYLLRISASSAQYERDFSPLGRTITVLLTCDHAYPVQMWKLQNLYAGAYVPNCLTNLDLPNSSIREKVYDSAFELIFSIVL